MFFDIFSSECFANSKKHPTFASAFEKEVIHKAKWCGSSVG